MANEIQVSLSITGKNGSFEHRFQPSALSISQTTPYGSGGGQVLNGTSPETLVITDVSAAGMFYCRNLSTSVTVQIGRASGTNFTALASLLPGEYMFSRLAVTNPSAACTTTNTAAVNYFMFDA